MRTARRRSKVALFNIERSEWAARHRVWSGRRSHLTGDRCGEVSRPTSTAALARSNSSSRDWCLDRRALPHRCSLLRRACHAHTQAHGGFLFFLEHMHMCVSRKSFAFSSIHTNTSARGVGGAGRERVQGQPSLCFLPASTKPTTCLGRPAESLPSAPRLPAALLILLLSISSASLTAHSGACRVCCMGLIGSVR